MMKISDTCSWKGQLEKTRIWKVRHEIGKDEVERFAPNLGSSRRSWKVQAEVGTLLTMLESFN